MPDISQARLKATFFYDPKTGNFTHKFSGLFRESGSRAEETDPDGYLYLSVDGERMGAHRAAYLIMRGNLTSGYHIHHRDGNKRNNAIHNLEEISPEEHGRIHALRR